MHGRGVFDDAFLGGVAVEPGKSGQSSADGRRCAAEFFELSGVELDVGAGDLEQGKAVLVAPPDELA